MRTDDDEPKPPLPSMYLGDGVYVKYEDAQFVVYTSDGLTESNHIYFEGYMIGNLMAFHDIILGVKNDE